MTDYDVPLDALPDPFPVEPLAQPFDATIRPPGSKSITNRAYVLAALAGGPSHVKRPLRADDTDRLLDALGVLGVRTECREDDVVIEGAGGRFPAGGAVDLGLGGTPTRFMIAAACLAAAPVVVDGAPRMRERPVAEGVDLLRRLGARIDYVERPERLPVRITPSDRLVGGAIDVPATLSSQFVSALLLVAPFLPRGVEVSFTGAVTSASYVRLTLDVLREWGCRVTEDAGAQGPVVRVPPAPLEGRAFDVEPDASSAVYWMVAAALAPGSRTRLPGMRWPPVQPDLGAADALVAMGVTVARDGDGLRIDGPPRLGAVDLDAREMPDASLALAVAAACGDGPSVLRGLHTLRVKETDRVAALANELAKIGCAVVATDDTLTIDPSGRHERPVVIETYDDHRMAMAFAVLGLVRPGLSIADPGCVRKSYPAFWRDLAGLR